MGYVVGSSANIGNTFQNGNCVAQWVPTLVNIGKAQVNFAKVVEVWRVWRGVGGGKNFVNSYKKI